MTYAPLNEMNLDRNTTNDLVWDEESGTYINAHNPTVKELEANGVVYDIVAKDLENSDYVVEYQRPTAENNYTWYRLYKSGWVEQGGQYAINTDGIEIDIPIEMSDTNYNVQITTTENVNNFGRCFSRGLDYIGMATSGGTFNVSWEVKGFAA